MEQALVEKVKNGSDHAFRVLIEKYKHHVFKTVYSILRNQKDAEDASQEVFVKIYTSLSQYENQGLKTWITRVAVNHAIDCKRKAARRHEEMEENPEYTAEAGIRREGLRSVEAMFEEKQLRLLVRRRLGELPESHRKVIYDYYIEEKSYKKMAEEQQVEVKTIETKLYRARLWMRKHWKEEDFR
ncbi:sigma-70 family RNA polymerase sigma factor [Bacillus salacetis]|uniref:Sigma-70 family RNA polymerase sigma factor n=1 Tax=Bacillus salacetis TaxID=2315464 RepID=A0A3A1QYI4_9BACI|nr:sigma-70 family RNA polymerase sigma factor [Bacillus salacetis]RIW33986.1 sigma-70 family RNA polymerase sigma factor [Bacillus salacetis]